MDWDLSRDTVQQLDSFPQRVFLNHPQGYLQLGLSPSWANLPLTFDLCSSMHLLVLKEHSLFIGVWILPVHILSIRACLACGREGNVIWFHPERCRENLGDHSEEEAVCVQPLWSSPVTVSLLWNVYMKIYGVRLVLNIHNKATYFICK